MKKLTVKLECVLDVADDSRLEEVPELEGDLVLSIQGIRLQPEVRWLELTKIDPDGSVMFEDAPDHLQEPLIAGAREVTLEMRMGDEQDDAGE